MSKLTRQVTLDEVAAYRIAGVVLLRGIIDITTVNTLRRCIDQAVSNIENSPSGYNLSALTKATEAFDKQALDKESDGQHDVAGIVEHIRASGKDFLYDDVAEGVGNFILDSAISSHNREFKRLATKGPGAEIATALLGSETVRFFGDQIFVKEPGTRERTAFHQDATYFEIDGDQCCVLWIPTDPVTFENGAMIYVRGSHKNGQLYQPNVFVSQTSLPGAQGEPLPDIEGNLSDYDVIHFDVEPGDIIVHHYRTVHGAGGNNSKYQVRRAASFRYCGDDIRFKTRPWAPKQLHQTHQLQDGEPLSGPDFPVVSQRVLEKKIA